MYDSAVSLKLGIVALMWRFQGGSLWLSLAVWALETPKSWISLQNNIQYPDSQEIPQYVYYICYIIYIIITSYIYVYISPGGSYIAVGTLVARELWDPWGQGIC